MMTDAELVRRCVEVRRDKGYPIAWGLGEINTDYIEGLDPDGVPNENRKNAFDDLHIIYTFKEGGSSGDFPNRKIPVLLYKARCTTQPGTRYTLRPINEEGAAIIELGYQECWQPGLHRGNYPALIQTGGPCKVWRDRKKNYARGQGSAIGGYYGINQHHANDAPRSDIGTHSAGCLTTELVLDHQAMLRIKKTDPRYLANRDFVFGACVMTAAWVTGIGDQDARPRPPIQPDAPKGLKPGVTGGGATLTGMGGYFSDHWMWFAAVGVAIGIGLFLYFWREPFGASQRDASNMDKRT